MMRINHWIVVLLFIHQTAFVYAACSSITTQPSNAATCDGGNATFTVVAAGGGTTYAWKVSTDGGTTYTTLTNVTPYTGSTTATLTITGATAVMNGYLYRCTLNGACGNTNAVTLTVNPGFFQVSTANIAGYYPFSGNANDKSGTRSNGTLQSAPTAAADRFGISSSAYTFNGSTQYVSTALSIANPTDFTYSTWFKTTTTSGGLLIGFGNSQTGLSTGYDRTLYMNDAGVLYFGIYTGLNITINSSCSYNDGAWHMATVSLSGTNGMKLYVDGALVSSDPSATTAQNITGYVRIAYDNLLGWPSYPSSYFFNGTLDDIYIYLREMTSSEVSTLYSSAFGATSNSPLAVGATLNLTAPTISGATYSWTGPNSFSSTSQNPSVTYATAYAGTFTVAVTKSGCTSSAYALVSTSINVTSHPADVSACIGSNTSFTVATTGSPTYQWQMSTDGGTSWTMVPTSTVYSTANTATLTITGVKAMMHGYTYRCVLNGCVAGVNSNAATLTVNPDITQASNNSLAAYYPFNANANDEGGTGNNGTLQNAPTAAVDRFGNTNAAYTFNGTTQYVSTANPYSNPNNFTISAWFKTSTATGGQIIGFGEYKTGASPKYDRKMYMTNAGVIYFGVYNGSIVTVNSTSAYNDGNWHLAVASLSSTNGIKLYIDGSLAGSDPGATNGENYNGYWKIAYDNVSGWTNAPTSNYFSGTLDDVSIYTRELSAAEVSTLYSNPFGAGSDAPICSGSLLTLSGATASGATYSWTGPNSFSSSSQNPTLTYSSAYAGTYTLVATAGGCTTTAYAKVTSNTSLAGQWTGGTSTNWNITGNWCNSAVPTSTVDVTIPGTAPLMPSISSATANCKNLTISSGATLTLASTYTLKIYGNFTNNGTYTSSGTQNFTGSTAQTIAGSSNSSFYNMTLTNANGLTLAPSTGVITSVRNTLTFSSGKITLGAFELAIGAAGVSGSISGATSSMYVITNGTGQLNQYNIGTGQRTSVAYPIGVSSSSYTPVTLNVSGASTVDNFKAGVSQTVYSDGTSGTAFTANVVDRTWDVTEGTDGGSSLTLTVQWNGAEELSFTRSACNTAHYTSGDWVPTAADAAASGSNPYTIVSGVVTSFSPFAVHSSGVLPIELIYFKASPVDKTVNLQWETATEINNDYFTVERSLDGINFEIAGTVKGAGNSTTSEKYLLTDDDPFIGTSYYRLKQTDYDGKYTYSKIVAVNIEMTEHLHIFPNPVGFDDLSSLTASGLESDKEALVVVYDMRGIKLYSKIIITNSTGAAVIGTDPAMTLPSGVYMIIASSKQEIYRQKLVVK